VAIRVDATARSAEVDFTGTSPQQTNNFNAPTAVCMAAALYVFRTLVNDDIPLNAGCLKPIKVIIPAGSMLNPNSPASVVAGNVETSSCITNALFGALGVMAASPVSTVWRAPMALWKHLSHIGQAEMQVGDVFEMHTPGGGGFGAP
jgi:5-oxoprolinase (ATP-hydrolysing)